MSYEISYEGTSFDENVEELTLNESYIYKNYGISAKSSINIPKTRNDDSSSQKLIFIDSDEISEDYKYPILKPASLISFDSDVKEEMFEKVSFRKFISEIEKNLFLFEEKYKISFNVKICYQQDWEVEDLRNIILLIKFNYIPFKEELKLWKKLSLFVREGLQISEDFLGSKEFIKYNKDFYIKLDLT